jgi:hypothetical protein
MDDETLSQRLGISKNDHQGSDDGEVLERVGSGKDETFGEVDPQKAVQV